MEIEQFHFEIALAAARAAARHEGAGETRFAVKRRSERLKGKML